MILDASVAAKWFLKGEIYEAEALRLRQDYEAGNLELRAPSLILYEISNAIWKRKDISGENAAKLAGAASEYLSGITVLLGPHDFHRLVSNARVWDVTAYDSSYVTLSEELKMPFITADEDLRKRVRRTSIPVIFLADYEAPQQ